MECRRRHALLRNHACLAYACHAKSCRYITLTIWPDIYTSNLSCPPQPSVVEDEWKEFKAEERKDYSGLKIGQLQIADGDDEHTDGDAAYEKYDSDGEAISDADRQNNHGPWSRQADAENAAKAAAAAEAAAAAAPEPVAAAAAVDKNRSYVLPAMRMGDPVRVHDRKSPNNP